MLIHRDLKAKERIRIQIVNHLKGIIWFQLFNIMIELIMDINDL